MLVVEACGRYVLETLCLGSVALLEASCFPFYRRRGRYRLHERERDKRGGRRLLGSPGPSSPSCGSRRSCRCQQGRLHVTALFVTDAMRRRRLPVMAFHSVPTDIVVN